MPLYAAELQPWHVRGTYVESCNCDAICPCRMIDEVRGGRSTYGLCLGALSWLIEEGRAGDIDLAGLGVVLASRYSDDEPGSPWTFALYVDERGDEAQRHALGEIFTGRAGGTALEHFPWAWKESELVAVRPTRIEIDHTPRRQWFRAADIVTVHVSRPVEGPESVRCVIPGYERPGEELYADELRVADEPPLAFEFSGNCAYASVFEYSSEP
jgi:hypothetical protein